MERIKSNKSEIYLADINEFLQKHLNGRFGRPQFVGQVKKNDEGAIIFFINRILDKIEQYDLILTYVVFAYLSDLSSNEERAGGYDGLLGPDNDIRMLRKKLLLKLQSLHNLSVDYGQISPRRLAEILNSLFTRAMGIREAEKFRDENGSNHQHQNNPYDEIPPDELLDLMQLTIRKTISSL